MELLKVSHNATVKMVLEGRVSEIPTPNTVKEAVEIGIPLVMVEKVTGPEGILYAIEIALTDIIRVVNIDSRLNIQPHQTRIIAETIFENFKTESLEDFKLAFRRGSAGFYGEIYRLDGAVIVRWVQCYLEEKYTIVDQAVTTAKDAEKEIDIDYQALIQRRKKEAENGDIDPVRQREIAARKHEIEYQTAKLGYKPLNREDLGKYDESNRYILDNFNPDGTKKENWKPKEEWLKDREPLRESPKQADLSQI